MRSSSIISLVLGAAAAFTPAFASPAPAPGLLDGLLAAPLNTVSGATAGTPAAGLLTPVEQLLEGLVLTLDSILEPLIDILDQNSGLVTKLESTLAGLTSTSNPTAAVTNVTSQASEIQDLLTGLLAELNLLDTLPTSGLPVNANDITDILAQLQSQLTGLVSGLTSTGSSLPGLGLPTDSLVGTLTQLLASIVAVVESLVGSLLSSVPLPAGLLDGLSLDGLPLAGLPL